MLYFGYLLPLCILMVGNMAVFCLVYRAMARHHKHMGLASAGGESAAWSLKISRKPGTEQQADNRNSCGQCQEQSFYQNVTCVKELYI